MNRSATLAAVVGPHLIARLIQQHLNPPQFNHHHRRRHLDEAAPNQQAIQLEATGNDQDGQQQQQQQMPADEQGATMAASVEQPFGDWWNEYWSRQPFPSGYTQSSITLLACLITTIIFLIVVGNLLVVVAIFTEKSLKPTQNWFIASLAVSDMLLGLVVMPFSLARELMGFWVFGQLWCDIHEAIDVLLTTASINTLCLISLDRYWSITQAVNYLKKRTPRRGAFMIAFVWIFSAAVSLPPLFGWKKENPPIMGPAPIHRHPVNHTASSVTTTRPTTTTAAAEEADGELSSSLGADEERQERRRRRRPNPNELARPVLASRSVAGPSSVPLAALNLVEEPTTSAGSLGEQQQQQTTTEYPSCQLSDDVGYVLYSALGSFYIPCAVMVFTYIKIFLAARSRARRAISKQANRGVGGGGGGGGAGKRTGGQRAVRNNQQEQQQADGKLATGELAGEVASEATCIKAPPRGKIVIVERRKSVAPSQQQQLDRERAKTTNELAKSANTTTLTTSGAHKASLSALNSSASNDSSMITVMNTSMGELPVTRFQFHQKQQQQQQPQQPQQQQQRGDTRAAALLDALRRAQVNTNEEERRMLEETNAEAQRQVPDIVVASKQADAEQETNDEQPAATNETCFMTIEEDSDMFDAQAGRTIVIPAAADRRPMELVTCNNVHCQRRHQQTNRSGSSYCGSSLTINDDDEDDADEDDDGDDDEEEDDDEDDLEGHLDECELLTDDCNGYSVSCGLDQYSSCGQTHCQECEDEAAAASADIEQPHQQHRHLGGSSGAQHRLTAPESPIKRLPATTSTTGGQHRHLHQHHHQQQQQQQQPGDRTRREPSESELGIDDNMSLTEFRSNDETSSVMGHDMLDASDERPKSAGAAMKKKHSIAQVAARPLGYLAERKMSSIGMRLARLGGSSPLSGQAGGLLDVAAQQQQQATSTGRNLKALRQNFFMKLNQLTAKSQAKQESKAKKASETSPTSKLSAQSSGTSYEQSVDCATTSNVHSADYPPETTIDDGPSVVVKQLSQDQDTHEQQQQHQHSEILGTDLVQAGDETERHLAGSTTLDTCEQSSSNNNTNNPSRQDKSDDRVLLLNNDNKLGSQDLNKTNKTRLDSQTQLAKRSSSSARQANNSSTMGAGGGGREAATATSKSMMAKSSKQPVLGNHAGSVQSAQTSTGAQGSVAVTNRAYLASDNERHKRKLAKARERRATLILGLIMAAFVSAWMPFFTFYVLRALCTVCRDYISPRFEAFIFWMGYCNSAINPIIYTIFNRDFRKAFRKILFKCL